MTTLHVKSPNGTEKTVDIDKIFTTDGGTMGGCIEFSRNDVIKRSNDTELVAIFGARDNTSGAYLTLRGKNHPSMAGYFDLHAVGETEAKTLEGRPDGTLIWNNNIIITSAGGSINGHLYMSGDITRANNTWYQSINGGKDVTRCAYIHLYGGDNDTFPGWFSIAAKSAGGANNYTLQGTNEGKLLWRGREVIYESARNLTERSGYCKLNNGLLLQYGTAPATTSPYTLTFPIAWSSSNSYAMSICHAGTAPSRVSYSRINNSQATLYLENTGDTFWIAIGY